MFGWLFACLVGWSGTFCFWSAGTLLFKILPAVMDAARTANEYRLASALMIPLFTSRNAPPHDMPLEAGIIRLSVSVLSTYVSVCVSPFDLGE